MSYSGQQGKKRQLSDLPQNEQKDRPWNEQPDPQGYEQGDLQGGGGSRSIGHTDTSHNTTVPHNTSKSRNTATTYSNNTPSNTRAYNNSKHSEITNSEIHGAQVLIPKITTPCNMLLGWTLERMETCKS
ncbi:hypothetical protein BDD12DRAFT_279842 [Trichophaea hybrida]|nr:hypothetical protein BDD12DRAFT_279842 [Trichophaea hybrida]